MSIKDSIPTIAVVVTIIVTFLSLSAKIGDLRERITRVETVIDERLPRSPVPLRSQTP